MKQVTIQYGSTIPLVIDAGEYIKLKTSSLCAGTVAIPGEAVADTLVASSEYAYGKYTGKREVIVNLTAGSADVIIDSGSPPVEFNTPSNLLGATSSAALAAGGFRTSIVSKILSSTGFGQAPVMASPPTVTSQFTTSSIAGGVYYGWNSPNVYKNGSMTAYGINPYGAFNGVTSSGVQGDGGPRSMWIYTDSSDVEFRFIEFEGGNISFSVDNQYVSLTPTALASTYNERYVKLAFGSYQFRLIRVDMAAPAGQTNGPVPGGFVVKADAQVFTVREPRVFLVGDSYVQLSNTLANAKNGLALQLGRALGVNNIWPIGAGSRGYIAGTPGTAPNLIDRMDTELIPYVSAGDLVININGFNDMAISTPAQFAEAATTYVNKLKMAVPGAIILQGTPLHPRPDYYGAYAPHDAAFKSAMASLSVPVFDNSDIFTGGGYGGSGTGNSARYISADAVHPADAGFQFLGYYALGVKIRAALTTY